MLKLVSVIAAAALLLLISELFTSRLQASVLIGTIGIQSVVGSSDVEKAACDAADEFCEKGKTLSLTPGKAGPEVECAVCLSSDAESPICPKNPRCCAPPGTARICPVIGYCFCPR